MRARPWVAWRAVKRNEEEETEKRLLDGRMYRTALQRFTSTEYVCGVWMCVADLRRVLRAGLRGTHGPHPMRQYPVLTEQPVQWGELNAHGHV